MNANPIRLTRRSACALALAGSLGAGALALTASAAAAQTNLRIATVNPPTNLSVQIAEAVGKRITERTDGRLTFQVFPSAQLGTTTDSLEQASQGQPVIAFTSASFMHQPPIPFKSAPGSRSP